MPEPLPSLDELRRQREIVAGHLAWLDRQIARREAGVPTPTSSTPPATAQVATVESRSDDPRRGSETPPHSSQPSGADPDAILEQFRVEPTNVTRDVRRGCLMYFLLGFVLLGALVWLLYVALR